MSSFLFPVYHIFLQIYYNLFQAGQQKNCLVRKSWDKSENSANGAAQYSPWWSVAQPWVRHRITLPKTGIDGYGVPVRNDIFANAMISPDHHCHHDAACFCRNTVNAVAVIMRVQGTYTQGSRWRFTLGFTVPCRWHWLSLYPVAVRSGQSHKYFSSYSILHFFRSVISSSSNEIALWWWCWLFM